MLNAEYSIPSTPLSATQRLFKRGLEQKLSSIQGGQIILQDAAGESIIGQGGELNVRIAVKSPAFYQRLGLSGSVGAGEAYIRNEWACSDLVSLVRLLVRNRELLDRLEGGASMLAGWLLKRWYDLRKNSLAGSRRNIAEHYDLGNELFHLFLDQRMQYSSALYRFSDYSLERAQLEKLRRIGDQLQLGKGDHLLEIGSGWGGLAVFMAENYGCKVTTTTISQEQHDYARALLQERGLEHQVTVLNRDYRDLRGLYSHLVSVEMVEAVGHQYLQQYFQACQNLLQPGGKLLLQAITIEDHRYQRALKTVDFIKRFVFPGSFIPSEEVLRDTAEGSGLQLQDCFNMGRSYALTLREWRRRFMARLDQVSALGYSQDFIRMWEFYLCYCEGAFLEGSIDDVQMLFEKPGALHS